MKKIITSIISNIIMIVVPLIPKPALMIHPKILIVVAGSICLWLTQPAFSMKETAARKSKDKYSVLIILLMSSISLIVPVIIWAYFTTSQKSFGIVFFIGLFTFISGLLLRVWSIQKLGNYFTPTVHIQDAQQLVITGPYKYIRHPSYLGAFMAITAGALVLETWIGYVIAVIAMVIAYKIRIGIEEFELNAHFGNKYKIYTAATKKIIPFVW